MLKYATTNREGYREYKSDGRICAHCPHLSQCTESQNHVKVVTRHIWQEYMDICEDIRHASGMKEIYGKRRETIERDFGTAKEHHAMRHTQLIGKEKMSMKVGLTFACMNMKKLANILAGRDETGRTSGLADSLFTLLGCLLHFSSGINQRIYAQKKPNPQFEAEPLSTV